MTKNDLINDVAYELRDSMTKETDRPDEDYALRKIAGF